MAHGPVSSGTDGQVTWTTLGNSTSHVESWAATQEAAEIEITDFQATGWADYTTGIKRISGTIVCNARDGYAPVFAGAASAVLTLVTASVAPATTWTGSALLIRVDSGRAFGDAIDKHTYAFRGRGVWVDPANA